MTKLEALVCKFGTKYPSAYELMKDALVCLRRMGVVRSHYFATPSPIQNSMDLYLNNLSFPSPQMPCTKIVSYIGQVVLKKKTGNNLKTLRQRQTKGNEMFNKKNAFELLAQMKW